MNSGIDPIQLASQGAQVLVAEMVKTGWAALRGRLASIFRRTGSAPRQLEMLDADQQELSQAPEGGREAVRARLLARWNLQLAALLDLYPDAGEDLLALIEELAGSEGEGSGGHTVSAFGNVASRVVQAGGDVHTGGGDISFTPPAL